MGTVKPLIIHRWALVDAQGRTRGTCKAHNIQDAARMFETDSRYGMKGTAENPVPIPKDWSIVARGPVKGQKVRAEAPAPEAPALPARPGRPISSLEVRPIGNGYLITTHTKGPDSGDSIYLETREKVAEHLLAIL